MSGSAAERIASLTEEVAATIGRRTDRMVGELSDGAQFSTIQNPSTELVATVRAFLTITRELESAVAEADAVTAAMLQLEARGASDDIVRFAEARAAAAAEHQDALLTSLERLAAGIKSGRRRSS
ncbi:MAG: hypothetical protein EP330_24675 [Deltaproteobacteria bacterium]|nr:MAG: hypothetical protein EP330_24675 [Deltaproteobacteria bacterium]